MADSTLAALGAHTPVVDADSSYIENGGTAKKVAASVWKTYIWLTPTLGGHMAGGGFDMTGLGTLSMTEQAAANADVAGDGQVWVKTASPNELWFTDDAGTDFQLASFAGTETLTNKTLTSPVLTAPVIATTGKIVDAGGDEYLVFVEATTPVTYAQITSGDTGVAPRVQGAGEANTDLHLLGSGTGNVVVSDGTDPTKDLVFELSGATTVKTMILASSQTDDRTLTLPDATDTLVGKATTDTLTNKTLTAPTLTTPALGVPASGTLTSCDSVGRSVATGLTADVGSVQGGNALTNEINVISTCANVGDATTLPAAAAGLSCTILNNGANATDVFPASGDDAGAGVNTAVSLAAAANITYLCIDGTTWFAQT